jgi:ectoine hydroxylase-related dioxygenase (phytanoyl-CoA dioxygenase family)
LPISRATSEASLDDGYAIHPQVFARDWIDAFAQRLDQQPLSRSRAGARHLMTNAVVRELAHDARLLGLARNWLRADAIPFKATLFDKSPETNWLVAWHQDTAVPVAQRRERPGWGPWSEKEGILYAHAPAQVLGAIVALRVHLDDSTPDNGPLRVLPGTHERGVLSDEQVHDCARVIGARQCCLAAGGVVAMRPLLIHASSKVMSPRPRRVIHIEYAASLEVGQVSLRVA